MSLTLSTPYIPAAPLGTPFYFQLVTTDGTAPYTYAIISGALPPGLTLLSTGEIVGTPTQIGIFNVVIEVSDSNVSPEQLVQDFRVTCIDIIELANTSVDQEQFVQQLSAALSVKTNWSTGITTQTSQTLIDLIAAIGTFATSRIVRVKEDAFMDTAQSDSAILSNAVAQGLRLSRKLPASATVSISSTEDVAIAPYTQFSGAGLSWFNPEQISLRANVPTTIILYEGQVKRMQMNGLGTNLQTWASDEDKFVVSDQHVQVSINGVTLYKTYEGLWNYPQIAGAGTQQQAFADRTLPNGRLLVQFGSQGYGAVPGVNDIVLVTYAVTQGDAANATTTTQAEVTAPGLTTVTAEFTSNPTGGASQRNSVEYKNFGAGTFGTFSSGVTKAQYRAVVNNYPGIIDTVTQAQREVNPRDLAWMNVIRVSALTSSTWTQTQIREYLNYCQSQTMYSTYMVWEDPAPIDVTVDISVYCYNSVPSTAAVRAAVDAALTKLFTPRPGLLLTNFYESDLIETAKNAAPGQISYVVVNKPTQPMIVTAPASPATSFTIVPSGGTISPGVYNYAVSVDTPTPNPNFKGLLQPGAFTNFPSAEAAGEYWLVAKDGNLRDPLTGNLTAVLIGQQVLATGAGSLASNFTVVSNPVGVIDIGAPTHFVAPQVTVTNSQVVLDWSANPTPNAIQYYVWGRVGGATGIMANLTPDTTTYVDDGSFTPTPIPVTTFSSAAVRYNRLQSLTVRVDFADRQSSATLPVRDTL